MTSDRINIMAIAREFPRLWESSTALELFAFARKCIEADREAHMDAPWVDLIMQQAQVLASAWSLVGGQFDKGDMLEVAETERASLRKMIEGVAALLDQHHRDSAGLHKLCDARNQARRTAEYWKAEHAAANKRIAQLESQEASAAARDVLAERRRQVEQEGWTTGHDDGHSFGQMATAAACYAAFTGAYPAGDPCKYWPWAAAWWKPTDPRRNLVKAGALILAEIERLDRANAHN